MTPGCCTSASLSSQAIKIFAVGVPSLGRWLQVVVTYSPLLRLEARLGKDPVKPIPMAHLNDQGPLPPGPIATIPSASPVAEPRLENQSVCFGTARRCIAGKRCSTSNPHSTVCTYLCTRYTTRVTGKKRPRIGWTVRLSTASIKYIPRSSLPRTSAGGKRASLRQ